MKKIILSMAAAIACTAASAQKLHITSDMEGTADSVAIIALGTESQTYAINDTVATKNGKIDFTAELKETAMVYILNLAKEGRKSIHIYGLPNEECHITGQWGGEYFVDGSKFYQQYNDMDRTLTPIKSKQSEIAKKATARLQAGEDRETVLAEYEKELEPVKKQVKAETLDYIKKHPDNPACATLLEEFEPSEIEGIVALLSPEVREGAFKSFINIQTEQAKKEMARLEMAKNVAPGKPAPEITLNDINGKPFSLSSLKGKYVILDFWGSWCSWCIKGVPQMKEYYKKYEGKFEILGIDCNDTEQKWKDAVAKYELPWLHVYNPNTSDVLTRYAIEGFPTKIIVDPEGNINKVIVGEDPAFYTYLDSLFK